MSVATMHEPGYRPPRDLPMWSRLGWDDVLTPPLVPVSEMHADMLSVLCKREGPVGSQSTRQTLTHEELLDVRACLSLACS